MSRVKLGVVKGQEQVHDSSSAQYVLWVLDMFSFGMPYYNVYVSGLRLHDACVNHSLSHPCLTRDRARTQLKAECRRWSERAVERR